MKTREARNLEPVGGSLCLDFANTVSTRAGTLGKEYLTTYDDLVAWSLHAGILAEKEAERLRRLRSRHPKEGHTVLNRAVEVRETIYRIFSAIAKKRSPRDVDIRALNRLLSEALSRLEIRSQKGRFEWGWAHDTEALDIMLWPVAQSAAQLLIAGKRSSVRHCAAHPACGWLFLDTSKNQRRRWCSMKLCGSRAKIERFYRRKKAPSSSNG